VHEDFVELGGHSMLAKRLVNRIGQRYAGARLTLRALFDTPTVAGLAARIAPMLGAAGEPPATPGAIPGRAGAATVLDATGLDARARDALDPDALAGYSDAEVAALLARLAEERR
jgi:hypothetical protein